MSLHLFCCWLDCCWPRRAAFVVAAIPIGITALYTLHSSRTSITLCAKKKKSLDMQRRWVIIICEREWRSVTTSFPRPKATHQTIPSLRRTHSRFFFIIAQRWKFVLHACLWNGLWAKHAAAIRVFLSSPEDKSWQNWLEISAKFFFTSGWQRRCPTFKKLASNY